MILLIKIYDLLPTTNYQKELRRREKKEKELQRLREIQEQEERRKKVPDVPDPIILPFPYLKKMPHPFPFLTLSFLALENWYGC